ncbi:hypothetical protein OIU78_010733 [Salix suchowensis]|nr:hypothetical protein OIU78_010733 [Salix suchowensis]
MDIKFHHRAVEDDIIMDQVDSPEIVDDLELGQDEAVDIKDKEVNKQKLRKRIDQFKSKAAGTCSGASLLHVQHNWNAFCCNIFASQGVVLLSFYRHENFVVSFASFLFVMINLERNCLFWILTTRCLITDPQQRIHLNSSGHDLHEFLTAVYAEYDIMTWSATRW